MPPAGGGGAARVLPAKPAAVCAARSEQSAAREMTLPPAIRQGCRVYGVLDGRRGIPGRLFCVPFRKRQG